MCKCDTIQIVSPPPPPFARKEEWHSDAFKGARTPEVQTSPLTPTLTLLLLLLTGAIFSYFCMSSITSVLILAILIAIVLF